MRRWNVVPESKVERTASVRRLSAPMAVLVALALSASACVHDTPRRPTATPSPGVVGPYLDDALDLIEEHGWYARSDEWPDLRAQATERGTAARTIEDAHAVLEWVLTALGDRHGNVVPASEVSAFDELLGSARSLPEARELGRIGYLSVPGWGPEPSDRSSLDYILDAWSAIADLDPSCGWVIDLRTNEGGDLWVMLEAALPFVTPRAVSGLTADSRQFPVRFHRFFRNDPALGDPPTPWDGPVAVLVGPETFSAGEWLLVALSSRPSAQVFGTPTGGGPGSPERFELPDGALLLVTTAVAIDGAGVVHAGPIEPDVLVPPGSGTRDTVLIAGLRWLRSECP
jgi:hypothetical protein